MDLEILKIASNTDNHKILKNHTHNSKLKNPICGDEMLISIKVVKDNIVDFGYQGKSCVYCQASASLLSRNSINKSIIHVKNLLKIAETFFEKEKVIFPKEWSVFNKVFNKKNISRKECLLLPFKTLMKALKL
ncbi:MAG: iron-sulfur cluster assembly scaffold protein [Pelagibacteraceae bacterium]|jgi:nitrogen fixation NifU-like protein|nr:iron-sulfur cluster assembly scaffold protein [Pelagibacteraceae bacterium]HJM78592.1 iron-sulfur cluster assembly scaffold protein [Candidatus Pelagibacter bacterium]|tara:strand:- start:627 stop:1025 length:399 start_codon:yes stop_codon:yes gene_type:complete